MDASVYQPYIAAWRKRRAEEQQRQQARAAAGRELARQCARFLAAQYGARRVILFGSLARGEAVHAQSDIDLAVEGLAPAVYFRALAQVWQLLPLDVELDLVPLETARPELLEHIAEEGIVLYEQIPRSTR